jgi:hypothetical protein
MNQAQINAVLSGLAKRFEERAVSSATVPTARGWGQFLDGAPSPQIGLYGTAAGVLTRALAGQGQDILATESLELLQHWWDRRFDDDDAAGYMCQTVRLAFLHMALRLSELPAAEGLRGEVAQTLKDRVLPNHLWGNWVSEDGMDVTPRVLPSALVVLSFSLNTSGVPPIADPLLAAASASLEDVLAGSARLSPLQQATAAASILAANGRAIGRGTRSLLKEIARVSTTNLSDLGVYFYQYEYLRPSDRTRTHDRGYFIAPTEVILAIAGYQPGSPSALRLRAETTLASLVAVIGTHDGVFLPVSDHRTTSKDQAWAALLLAQPCRASVSRGSLCGVGYRLCRERKDNWFTAIAFPLISYAAVCGYPVISGSGWPRFLSALAALLVCAFYHPPTTVRRMFRPREW